MAALVSRTGEDSERSATKRCFSPSQSSKRELDAKRNRSRRRQADPLLVMLQKSSLSRENQVQELMRLRSIEDQEQPRLHSSESDSDLIGSFGKTSDNETVVEVAWRAKRHDSLPTPTLAMVETDILGSLDSHSAEVGTPLDWLLSSSSSCLWSRTCSDFSCSSPAGSQLNSHSITSRSRPQSSCLSMEEARAQLSRRASLGSTFSSSYTSWTKPVVGRQQSDSCVPASSILDMAEEDGRSRRSVRVVVHHRQRDRSADTSKDISEIDDFELDILEDFELPHDDEEGHRKGGAWLAVSPDLAYSSMEPSHRSQPAKPDS